MCPGVDGAGGRCPSPNAQTIVIPAATSVLPPVFALDGCALLPRLLLSSCPCSSACCVPLALLERCGGLAERIITARGLVSRRHRWPRGSRCVAWLCCCCSSSQGRSGPGRGEADDASLGSVGFVGGSRSGEKINCTWDISFCVGFSAGGCADGGEGGRFVLSGVCSGP